jgi:pyruvate/2-oxoglutarate dehydrogenase complex dihydrolipoamide dehydrogenase (E3) component
MRLQAVLQEFAVGRIPSDAQVMVVTSRAIDVLLQDTVTSLLSFRQAGVWALGDVIPSVMGTTHAAV